ncbi:hypothetical protein M3Y97_00242000 [Aphelenchoides bicaudatus]|nr:hypothetical protein M3Y97_00242000 [Aphelenchoides bicaudatus]
MPSRNDSVSTGIYADDHNPCNCDQSSLYSVSDTQILSSLASTQDDVSIEEVVVQPAATPAQRTEMEELEDRLDEMMGERVQQSLQLQALRDGSGEMAPILGCRYLPSAISALKFISIAYWAFFVIRFICMADMSLLICLLGSVSLICVAFAFATEQHLFFWPYAFVALLEALSAVLQFISLLLLIYRSDNNIGTFIHEAISYEGLFGNALLDEMQSWNGVLLVMTYVCLKAFGFTISFMITSQVARIFYDKEESLQAQELNMDMHHQRMTGVIHRLEYLHRNHRPSTPPYQSAETVIQIEPPESQQCIAQLPPLQLATSSRSMPDIGRPYPNVRTQQSIIQSRTI